MAEASEAPTEPTPAIAPEPVSPVVALRQRVMLLDSETEYEEMNSILEEVAAIAPESVYVHPRILVFPNRAMRRRSEFAGKELCDLYEAFINSGNQATTSVKIGLFNTHTKTWLRPTPEGMTAAEGNAQADAEWMHGHAWAGALIRMPTARGKVLLIYDNEPNPHQKDLATLRQQAMLGAQRGLVYELQMKKHSMTPRQVFYNLDSSRHDGRQRCLAHALTWIIDTATLGNERWEGPADGRAAGFRALGP